MHGYARCHLYVTERPDTGTLMMFARYSRMPDNANQDRARAEQNQERARAERIFKAREHLKADASKATADYYAAQQKLQERTKELRQMRLAREARMQRDIE